MITKNPMQLKAFIKNMAAEKNISAQIVMQNYMLERLLERISLSEYRNNFILKGGLPYCRHRWSRYTGYNGFGHYNQGISPDT